MPTANDLVSRALRRVGILATGQTAEANDSLEGLDTLNDILDQWSLEDLMIVYTTIVPVNLVTGQTVYTVGAGGNVNIVRPIELVNATLNDAQGITYPISVVDFSNYMDITQKIPPQSTTPTVVSYQPTFPLGNLYVWQPGSTGFVLSLEVSQQFIRIADLAVDIDASFPVGFVKAMVDDLAYNLAIEYGRAEMIDLLREERNMSKQNIKRKNVRKTSMRLDSMFFPGAQNRPPYNPFSDT